MDNSTLHEIRQTEGNNRCRDCKSNSFADWASVSNGTIICKVCAGLHRNLGVNVSFVKSMVLDSWNSHEIEMLKAGGNDRITDYFKSNNINKFVIGELYCTEVAEEYRKQLNSKAEVNKIKIKDVSTTFVSNNDINHSGTYSLNLTQNMFDVTFEDGSISMTLSKTESNEVVVTEVGKYGAAYYKGVHCGDILVSVNNSQDREYENIMALIISTPRPIVLKFQRINTTTDSVSNDTHVYNSTNEIESNNSEHSTTRQCAQLPPDLSVSIILTHLKDKHICVYIRHSNSIDKNCTNSTSTGSWEAASIDAIHESGGCVDVKYENSNNGKSTELGVHFAKMAITSETYTGLCKDLKFIDSYPSQSFVVERLKEASTDRNLVEISSIIEYLVNKNKVNNTSGFSDVEDGDDEGEEQCEEVKIERKHDLRVRFSDKPLGLTLEKAWNGTAHVKQVEPQGRAMSLGIAVGDILIGIEKRWQCGYEEAISTLKESKYPLEIVFRKKIVTSIPS